MNEVEFVTRYQRDIPIYKAWGEYINTEITNGLQTKINSAVDLELFLKIPPKPRVKNANSIISKAFYRNKRYGDPYNEITDKVGVRYVVLLKEDINTIQNVIESSNKWSFSKDRDFEKEKTQNPTTFDYQSIHYIVRSNGGVKINGVIVPTETPCEVQIRTLLQHAYSELTHDTIYKPKVQAAPNIHRLIAKSMALIEVTDDIFGQATMTLKKHQDSFSNILTLLTTMYENIAEPDFEEKMNMFILDAFREFIDNTDLVNIKEFSSEKIVKELIKRKHSTSLIYRQPVIILIIYLIANQRTICKQHWPLSDNELKPLFSDLGIAFESAY